MDKNTLVSLVLESKILHYFVKYTGLLKEEQYVDPIHTLKAFLLLFIIPKKKEILYKKLIVFLKPETSKKVIEYKKIFITKKTGDSKVICELSCKSEWKFIMNIYGSLPYFRPIFVENIYVKVSMHHICNVFSFGTYNEVDVRKYENIKIRFKDNVGYSNDYYFLLVFYCIFYQIDYALFEKLNYYINKDKVDKYFSELKDRIFDKKIEDFIIKAIQID